MHYCKAKNLYKTINMWINDVNTLSISEIHEQISIQMLLSATFMWGAPNSSFRRNIGSADLNRLRYSDLIPVKTTDITPVFCNKGNDQFLLFS